MLSWSQLNDCRRAISKRWPRIWSLPVVPRSMAYAADRVPEGAAVLDIGSSDGRFGRKLASDKDYKTLDIDPRVDADYRDLSEVSDASRDVVVCFEMIEHVDLETAIGVVQGIRRVLKPGGRVFLSTPNIHHPWSYLRSATHVTPWCYDELGGVFLYCDLEVEGLFRCHKDSAIKGVLRRLAYPIYRVVDVDYAKSLLLVARRRA